MRGQKHSPKSKSELKRDFFMDELSVVINRLAAKKTEYAEISLKSESVDVGTNLSNNYEQIVLRLNKRYVDAIQHYTNNIIQNQFHEAIEALSEISSDVSNHAATRIAQLSAISVMGDRIDRINRENAEALDRLVNG